MKERIIFQLASGVFVVAAGWLLVLGVLSHRTSVPANGGSYTEAVVGSPQLINPVFASVSDVDTDLVRLIYSGLMRYDDQGNLVPDLATGVMVSPDQKSYTFALRHDVLWHDGEKFTAHDVVFTIETIQNNEINSPLQISFQGVVVTAVNDYTVRFDLKQPFAPFLSTLTLGILPEHLWSDIQPAQFRLHKYNLQPIGTGPFAFRRLVKDDTGVIYQFDLSRNDHYYGKVPYIQDFNVQFFPDYDGTDGAIQALREGKVDGLSFVPHDLKDKVERKHINLHTFFLPQYTALFLNQDQNDALKDPVVRAAMEMALNKDRVLHEALRDEGTVIAGPLLPGSPGYAENVTTTAYDLDKANNILDTHWPRISAADYRVARKVEILKELSSADSSASSTTSTTIGTASSTAQANDALAESQLQDELNAAQTFYRKSKDGKILSLTLVTANTPEYQRTAALVAGFWQEIGVKTDIRTVDPKDISHLVLKTRGYDVLLYGLIVGSDPDQYAFWHSSQVDYPGLNLSRYVNHSLDALLERARTTTDEGQLSILYQKIQATILADRPAIFLYSPSYTYATIDRVQGIVSGRVFSPADRFQDVTSWYVKTRGQWHW